MHRFPNWLNTFFKSNKYPVFRKPLLRIILLFLLPIAGCREEPPEYHTLDFGVFQLTTPGDWESFKENGIDSYVGGLTNGADTLWFDYGWYSQEIGDYPDTNSLYALGILNGLEAIVLKPKHSQAGAVAMSIAKVGDRNKFYISGDSLSKPGEVIAMLKTIQFKESDTTKNTALVFAEYNYQFIRSGAKIFQSYCAACHNPMKEATGPALNSQLLSQRTEEWLMLFFFDRVKVANDSLLLSRKQKFDDFDCYIDPALTRAQLKRLIDYIGRSNSCSP